MVIGIFLSETIPSPPTRPLKLHCWALLSILGLSSLYMCWKMPKIPQKISLKSKFWKTNKKSISEFNHDDEPCHFIASSDYWCGLSPVASRQSVCAIFGPNPWKCAEKSDDPKSAEPESSTVTEGASEFVMESPSVFPSDFPSDFWSVFPFQSASWE